MKKRIFFFGLLSLMATACNRDFFTEPEMVPSPIDEDTVFHAIIDMDTDEDTKTFFDGNLNVLWNADDRVTLFKNITNGKEYRFTGDDGDPGGDLEPVKTDDETFSAGTDLGGFNYAVYPYSSETKIKGDGTITYNFPDLQTYRENSFGRGANVMVAKSSDTDLRFKNAMGYLSFRLFGNNIHVSSVILKANGDETLAGRGEIVLDEDGIPTVSMLQSDATATKEIRLYCDDIVLGTSNTDYTEFMFAIPPTEFNKASGGFTLTVKTTDGGVFSKTAPIDLSIKRNRVEWMAPIEVVPTYSTQTISISNIKMAVQRAGGGLNKVNNVSYSATSNSDGSFTLLVPGVDFSDIVLSFTTSTGSSVMYGGKLIQSGVTSIDASKYEYSQTDGSKPVPLVVASDGFEKTFIVNVKNTGLPVVRITTTGFTQKDLNDKANATFNSNTVDPITPDMRVWMPEDLTSTTESASVRFEYPDGTVSGGGDLVTQVKGRGNATWRYNKRPYALKLVNKPADVLGMPGHKRWVLLANWKDRVLMRNDAVFWLAREAGMAYTPRGQFVELVFNGVHQGNYYLCEQIKIDKNRVNITEMKEKNNDVTGGFLMEIDSYFDEPNRFKSSEFQMRYMFKEPDEVVTEKPFFEGAYTYMQNFVNNFEKELKKTSSTYRGYADYLDIDASIWFMLINELSTNRDFFQTYGRPSYQHDTWGPHSTYLYKDAGENSKLTFGPVWDFDYEVFLSQSRVERNNPSGWRGFDNQNYYYYYLCKDPVYVARLKELWNSKKADLLKLTEYVDKVKAKLLLSEPFNTDMWGYSGTDQGQNYDNNLSFEDAVTQLKTNFTARVSWMDTKINAL